MDNSFTSFTATPSALTSILLSSNVQYGNCDDIENEEAIDTEVNMHVNLLSWNLISICHQSII